VRAAREEAADVIVLTTHGGCGWRPGVAGAVGRRSAAQSAVSVRTFSGPASERQLVKAAQLRNVQRPVLPQQEQPLRPELELYRATRIFLDGDLMQHMSSTGVKRVLVWPVLL
jgi:hypothetical protein